MIYLRLTALFLFSIVTATARVPSRSFNASGSLWFAIFLIASTVALVLWYRLDRTSPSHAKSKKIALLYVFLSAVATHDIGVLYTVVAGSKIREPAIVVSTSSIWRCHLVHAVTVS